ncbi:MAG: hypothetical protein LKI39_08540 [Bacteroides sp.]|jgi:hypothetical protein|nr:hypothetical protein [Bacteroides sp.]
MIEEDYILRLLTQFLEDISLFLSKRGKENSEKEIQILYSTYFRSSQYYYENNISTIDASISQYKENEQESRMQMLAELLYQDALIKNGEIKVDLLRKSLYLFQKLDIKSKTFSIDRRNKIQQIKTLLATR